MSAGKVDGAQISAIGNMASGDDYRRTAIHSFQYLKRGCKGAQVSHVFNISRGDFTGAQVSGVFNYNSKNITGTQISCVFNHALERNVRGLQLSAVYNYSGKKVTGSQISAVFNYAGEDVKGAQITALPILQAIQKERRSEQSILRMISAEFSLEL